MSDYEDLAYMLTLLIQGVHPSIDKGECYEIIMELLVNGPVSEEDTIELGKRIARTKVPVGRHH